MEKKKRYRIVLGIMLVICIAILAAYLYVCLNTPSKTTDGILVERRILKVCHGQ